ncbi:MBL fold metallo-hydrolase RNA specificity domain-containing protein [Roseivirga sp. BDSF3-8]|uniref:MBL fold metallo-hydrolase RNA specificity domain-containing protein n=1 Tax=Roseivirga sp. BDSF3-8 TaxID=3241598 RepID=UPI00353234DD
MNVRLKFFGAAKSVTGSKYLLEVDDTHLLIDCGLFQGLKPLRERNWHPLPLEHDKIDAVLLTHAHIDHSGYLPRLFKDGYRGPVHCTEPTAELLRIMLTDSGRLQEEEAEFARKKGYSKHEYPQPLYTAEDAQQVFPHLTTSPMGEWIRLDERISFRFHYAGHILGASMVEVRLQGSYQEKTILFSGDLGRYNHPTLFNPASVPSADILLIESTYGDRDNFNEDVNEDVEEQFAEVVNESQDNGGVLLIPAFSVGRTQTIIYYLTKLIDAGRIPNIPVYIDSPMAISVTDLYRKFIKYHRLDNKELDEPRGVFDHPNLHYCRDRELSKSLNKLEKNAVILSASGMLTGGRILHHLYHRLPRENDTLLFSGFQPVGTRGRDIQDGEIAVKVFGLPVPIRCHVKDIDGLSAHADRQELHRWLSGFESSPKMTYIVHGEEESAMALQNYISQELKWQATVPDYLDTHTLFEGI